MQFLPAWPSWVKNLQESIHSRRSCGWWRCRWTQRNNCEQNAISTREHFLSRVPYHPQRGLEGEACWRCVAASCWAAWNRSTKPVELCKSAGNVLWREITSGKKVCFFLHALYLFSIYFILIILGYFLSWKKPFLLVILSKKLLLNAFLIWGLFILNYNSKKLDQLDFYLA